METPCSAAKISPDSGNGGLNSSSRFVFFDISNDSPVVGLTVGTPISSFKSVSRLEHENFSSESGEVLLRRQVKSLLQSIDEESEHPKRALRRSNCTDAISVVPLKFLVPPCTPTNTPSSSSNNNLINEMGAVRSHNGTTIQALQFDGLENYTEAIFSYGEHFHGQDKAVDDIGVGVSGGEGGDGSSVWSVEVNKRPPSINGKKCLVMDFVDS